MARKQAIAVQDHIETMDELLEYITEHESTLICMEIYSDFCGQCVPMLATIRKIKMEIGTEKISMAKACGDEIESLERFQFKSKPAYLFISSHMVTRVMFGADGIRLNEIIIEELALEEKEKSSDFKRPRFEFSECTPEEQKHAALEEERQKQLLAKQKQITDARQASRKQRVCERLAIQAPGLNFIIFFPHSHQAHYDLYEKWDPLNLAVFGKEEIQLTAETIVEAFYQSDVDVNEAFVHELLGGPVLVILFKAMETDTRDIVKLMRHVLYEEIPEMDPELSLEEQPPQMTAYQMYGITSKIREEVVRERWKQQLELKKTQREERKRLHEESKRLAKEAEEEKIEMQKKRAEEERMARLQAGALGGAAPELEPEAERQTEQEEGDEAAIDESEAAVNEENSAEVHEEEDKASDQDSVEFDYEKENDEEEYIPPGGLFIPGFYSPPNHLARANGIALFFPKFTEKFAKIESEFLPPHILMLYPIDKRHELQEAILEFKNEVLQIGIFSGVPPEKPKFVAYSVKQYDKMHTIPNPFVLSSDIKQRRSLFLPNVYSQLAYLIPGKNAWHLWCLEAKPALADTGGTRSRPHQRDVARGEQECAELFPVGYSDDFEEEETIVAEEEIEEEDEVTSQN